MRSSCWKRLSRSIAASALSLASIREAHGADKEWCMAAASTGQEVRDEGRLLDAREQFQRCAQTDCPAPIPTYCGDWLSDVAKKIPTVVIRVVDESDRDVADATVVLDERTIVLNGHAIEVDPGRHRLQVSRKQSKPFEAEIVAAQGEKDRVVLAKLVAEAPSLPVQPEPKPHKPLLPRAPTASWIGWGIGVVGLASFSVFGIKAHLDYSSYHWSCGQQCTMSERDAVATSVTVADVSLFVGLIGAGVGTVFYLMQPKATQGKGSTARASWIQ